MIPISYALRFHITNSGEQHSRAVFFLRSDEEEEAAAKKKVVQFIDAIACGDQREQSTGREYSMPTLGHETCAAKVKPCQLAAVTGGSAPQAFLDNVKHNASAGSSFQQVVNFPPAGGIIVRLLCSSLQMNKTPFLLFCWNHINGRADRQGQRRGSFECQIAARSAVFGWPLENFFAI